MTPDQVRDALRLLGWSSVRLSARCEIPTTAMSLFERTGYMPDPMSRVSDVDRLAVVRSELEAAGVEFVRQKGGGTGVKMRKR